MAQCHSSTASGINELRTPARPGRRKKRTRVGSSKAGLPRRGSTCDADEYSVIESEMQNNKYLGPVSLLCDVEFGNEACH